MTFSALGISIAGHGVDEMPGKLDKVAVASDRVEKAADRIAPASRRAGDGLKSVGGDARTTEGSFARLSQSTQSVEGSLTRLAARAGAAIGAAFSIRALQQYADAWSDMQSRVGAAVKDMEAAPALMQRMVDLANASYSPLEQTVDVYTRNVGILRDLGVAASGAADFTESLNHMLVITATRGERAASVQNALSKAMATGKLQADGLETVLANGGRVAEALANELGTTVSGLRSMSSEGKITGEVIKNALLNSLEDVREEAAKMPATIGDAFTRIQTNTTALVGTLDQAWGISGRVAEQMMAMANGIRGSADTMLRLGNIVGSVVGPAFDLLAANMGTVATVAQIAVAAVAGFYAPAMIGGLWATSAALVTGVAGGIKAVTLAMMANPLGLFIAGLAAAVTAAFMFRDQIKQAIGVDVVSVIMTVGDRIIGVFVGAYEAITEQFSNLPTFFSAIGKMSWNNFLSSFEGPALTIDTPWGSWQSGGLDLSGAKAQLSPDEMRSFGTAEATFNQAYLRGGYIKGVSDAIGEVWENASGAGDAIGALAGQLGDGSGSAGQGLAGAASAANDNMKTLADDGLAKVGQFGQQVLSTLSSGFADLFKGLISGTKTAGEAISDLLGKLGDLFINQAFNMLFGGMFGGFGGGGGNLLGGLLGFSNGGSGIVGGAGSGTYSPGAPDNTLFIAKAQKGEPFAFGHQAVTGIGGGQGNDNGGYIDVRVVAEVINGNMVVTMTEVAGRVAGQVVKPVSQAVDQMAQQQRYA